MFVSPFSFYITMLTAFSILQGFDTLSSITKNKKKVAHERVRIQLYYEALCPGSKDFYTNTLLDIYNKMHNYIDVQTYPYGNAKTIIYTNSSVEFQCQHGPDECYGNMLHACAIDILGKGSIAFNGCLMAIDDKTLGSDNEAVNKCGREMGVDVAPIKKCASTNKGVLLMKNNGDESHKAHYYYVPYVLVNGEERNNDIDFMENVCAAFTKPPPPCLK